MGSVFKKSYTLPLPEGAEVYTRDGKQFARWKPEGKRTRTAPITTGKDGSLRIRVKASTHTAKYRDGAGQVIEKPTGCRDEDAARAVLAELERRAQLVKAGVLTPKEDAIADKSAIPLVSHIEEYLAYLKAKGASKVHFQARFYALNRMQKECQFHRLSDLDRNTLERWLFKQVEDGKSARTMNAYRAAAISFAHWCIKTNRLAANPFEGIPKANEKVDRRRPRRALTEEELTRLIEAARKRPFLDALKLNRGKKKGELSARLKPETRKRLELLGWERALIYKTLFLTGLRRSELASITVGNLELDESYPHAILEAAFEKNREGSTIPLRSDLVEDLRQWLTNKLLLRREKALKLGEPIPARLPANTPVFNLPEGIIKIFDRDLEAAGIPKRDERGRTVDVHSLRHSFGTHLSKGGVPLRTAQAAMRHSDPKLTANVYTDPQLLDIAGALNVLPKLPIGVKEVRALEATGTTGAPEIPDSFLALNLAPTPGLSGQKQSIPDNLAEIHGASETESPNLPSNPKFLPRQEKDTANNRSQQCPQNNFGDPARILTWDLMLRRHSLYTG